jgi:hypothetical protein
MAGFPEAGKLTEIGHDCWKLAVPVSLSSFVLAQQGPGPQQVERQIFIFFLTNGKTSLTL